MLTIRELEIMKAALEGDIIYQRNSTNKDKPEFKSWLKDTERLLTKVSRKLFDEKAKESEK